MARMYERRLERKVGEALSDAPVVLIVGPAARARPRSPGRSGKRAGPMSRLTTGRRSTPRNPNPAGFARGLDEATIDEIQRAPELLLAIKKSVDDDYRPGRSSVLP